MNHYDREYLIDYLHGALEPQTDALVYAHLEACGACREMRDEEAHIGDSLRAALEFQEREMPAMVRARVWEAVRNEQPSPLQRLLRGWGPRVAIPVAAALAVAAYLVPATHTGIGTAPAGISASYYLDAHDAEVGQSPLGPGTAPAVFDTDTATSAAAPSAAASYIDTADAATLDDVDGAR
jgi:predicted anti-sigma-YlaC factor YlaD